MSVKDARAADPVSLKVGSLFSGYGVLDLAAEEHFAARTVWHGMLRGLGNGVVPQQALAALRRLEAVGEVAA